MASGGQRSSVKARAIVTHFGDDASGGEWSCSKDGNFLCTHRELAQRYLKQLGGYLTEDVGNGEKVDMGESFDYVVFMVLITAPLQLLLTRGLRALVEFLQFRINRFPFQFGQLYPLILQYIVPRHSGCPRRK